MADLSTTCAKGHLNSPGQQFCGQCGVALAGICPNGHQNPATQRHCGDCGANLLDVNPAPEPEVEAALAPSAGSRRKLPTRLFMVLAAIALLGGGILIGGLATKHNLGGPAGKAASSDTSDKPLPCIGPRCGDPEEDAKAKVTFACMDSVKANTKPDASKASFGEITVGPGIESHASILNDFQPENGDKQ
jgi:hypothetical protein